MFDAIPAGTKSKLWTHQKEALAFAIKYLNRVKSTCLIRMPTGTGKTGLIACLTCQSNRGSSLILTPWANLRKQMIADIERRFWETIKIPIPAQNVVSLFPSNAKQELNSTGKRIFVATFATLNALRREHPDLYEKLSKAISLVIVDEGHYEPAVEWGKSVKGLNCRTILLTATPYRNDLKLFRITDPKHSAHHFKHRDAVKAGVIRKLRCEELDCPTDIESLAKAFAKKWKEAKKREALANANPRAIVCCATDEDIGTAVTNLRKAGLSVIGVHQQFADEDDEDLQEPVPDPRKTKTEIWVHQNKLTEGLDDHRFCCVALFTRIRNDRKLIQQIGRVLRRHQTDVRDTALMLAPRDFAAEPEWNAYLEFETKLELLEPQHFRDVVDSLLEAQPDVEYFDGRFRRRFASKELSERPQVIIPPSVLVRLMGGKFSLEQYIEDCTDTLNTADAVILGPEINKPCQRSDKHALWVYASVRNSRFLQNRSLYEIKLETHCVVIAEGFVFLTDSGGNFPDEYIEDHTVRVPAKQLARFLDQKFRPTNVSVNSSLPYDTVLKGAELRGHNLLNIAASLTDRLHICRSVRGTSREYGRRYVGVSKARLRKELTEEQLRSFEPEVFVAWAEEAARILKSRVKSSELFRRYMPVREPPTNPVPKTISLDMLRSDLELELRDGRQCHFLRSSADIKDNPKDNRTIYTCTFEIEGNKIERSEIILRLDYHVKKQRFWFNKHKGPAVQVTQADEERTTTRSLSEFLNRRQDIVLIGMDDGETVYQGRDFYSIDYSHAESVLLDLISRPASAPACRSEKGSREEIKALKKNGTRKLPVKSVFRAVADHTINLPFAEDVLVCADLGTECADFIAANFAERKLALIHAKEGGGAGVSASAFHEVVAQAQKNLVYLTRSAGVPAGVKNWTKDSRWNGTKVPRLLKTLDGLPSGEKLWDKIKTDIICSSDPGLYVVLATTGCCDIGKLKTAATDRARRTPETAQLFHLLDGLHNLSRQLGVRLLIRDLPYIN